MIKCVAKIQIVENKKKVRSLPKTVLNIPLPKTSAMSSTKLTFHYLYDSQSAERSIYCFDSLSSLSNFEANKCKINPEISVNGEIIGIPKFKCLIYNDMNVLLNTNNCSLVVFEFRVHTKKVVDNDCLYQDEKTGISISKTEYCRINNFRPLKGGFKTSRVYELHFSNNNKIELLYPRFHDYVEFKSDDLKDLEKWKWIYKNNTENVIVNGFSTRDEYSLVSDSKNTFARYKGFEDVKKLGFLEIEMLPCYYDEVLTTTFVLITHQRLTNNHIPFTNGI